MKSRTKPMKAENTHELHEDDPELEREFRMLSQLLLDIYLWRREQQSNTPPQDDIDLTKQPPIL